MCFSRKQSQQSTEKALFLCSHLNGPWGRDPKWHNGNFAVKITEYDINFSIRISLKWKRRKQSHHHLFVFSRNVLFYLFSFLQETLYHCHWGGSGHVTPKDTTLAKERLWARGISVPAVAYLPEGLPKSLNCHNSHLQATLLSPAPHPDTTTHFPSPITSLRATCLPSLSLLS